VTGELSLRPNNPQGRSLAALRRIIVVRDGRREEREVTGCRPVEGGYLMRLGGVTTREAAAAFTLGEVRVLRTSLPPLEPGEYYVEDVPGCAVEDETGRALGVAVGTFWNGAHDVLTVVRQKRQDGQEGQDGQDELLIPLVPDFVLTVDARGRKIRVRWDDDV
jgi:16S rRNA processing protein RimM